MSKECEPITETGGQNEHVVIHGRDCKKVPHTFNGGYLHAEDDDGPYDVDGVAYCGRCHVFLDCQGR